jgi:dTDP-4-dehydrorhamnose 3,5-epimerase
MQVDQTKFKDVVIITPNVYGDDRGYFLETFNAKTWEGIIPDRPFVQDNESKSTRGVLRGLHFQKPPFTQAKLVRVVEGTVLDIIVDLRKSEPTYGQSIGVELSAENKKMFYVPRGFAHGFVVLSESAIFAYKCDNYYSQEHDGGVFALDDHLALDWGLPTEDIQLSDKDKKQDHWGQHFIFE